MSMIFLSSCKEEPKEAINTLEDEAKEIENLAERSKDINNAEDAFVLLRDLNQAMKHVRDAVLLLDNQFNKIDDEAKKESIEERFAKVNKEIDNNLNTISKNLDPYKDSEKVDQMMKKLEQVMISK